MASYSKIKENDLDILQAVFYIRFNQPFEAEYTSQFILFPQDCALFLARRKGILFLMTSPSQLRCATSPFRRGKQPKSFSASSLGGISFVTSANFYPAIPNSEFRIVLVFMQFA